MKKIITAVVLVSVLSASGFAQQKPLRILQSFHIASPGGWDYLAVSPVRNWLYVSHGTQVNILDKKTGDSVGIIENTTGVHGIAFDAKDQKGYTSNGRLNSVTVFDLNTNKVITQISAGANPDAIFYEPYSKKIITCNGRGKNLSIIDPVTDQVTDSVALGGKPETAVSDGAGKIFVNLEDKNQIAEIDAQHFTVLANWSLSPAEGPTGLALDNKTKRLFAGCDQKLVVLDAVSGKVIDTIPIGDGCDGVAFDPASKNIYTSNGEGTMTVIHEADANHFVVVQTLITKKSARTIALDPQTHLLYLPTAEFEPLEAGQKRPKMTTGSFQVLVAGTD